jgi:hypothetical protein
LRELYYEREEEAANKPFGSADMEIGLYTAAAKLDQQRFKEESKEPRFQRTKVVVEDEKRVERQFHMLFERGCTEGPAGESHACLVIVHTRYYCALRELICTMPTR